MSFENMDIFFMSRSYKKTPIRGCTSCHSERFDKFIWHKKWRLKERLKLAALKGNDLDNHSTTLPEEVSNPWSMGKDGKYYFPLVKQLELFEQITNRRGNNPQERSSLKKRLLRKWMGK